MSQQTWQGITVPAGTDNWNLVPDVKKLVELGFYVIPVGSQASRDGLTPPGGKYAGMAVIRTDLPGQPIETWNGSKWLDYSTANVTLGGLYQAYGGGYGTPGYEKQPNGRTFMTGMAGTTSPTITMLANTQYLIGTIPSAIAPVTGETFSPGTGSRMGACTLYVRADGNLHFESASGFSSITQTQFFISFSGINWRAKP
jgi:hypothetical protein